MASELPPQLSDDDLIKIALWTRDRLMFHQHMAEEAHKDYAPLRLEVARRGLWRAMMEEMPS